ncbi:hypothetical protein H1C71_040564 [Ictidomys tridecemlineatus]|nr:hypothetical protein H1C71_040564 [Ictidomys tridecemlineatus]
MNWITGGERTDEESRVQEGRGGRLAEGIGETHLCFLHHRLRLHKFVTAVISFSYLLGTHMPTHTHNPNPALDKLLSMGGTLLSWAFSAMEHTGLQGVEQVHLIRRPSPSHMQP